MPTITPTVGTTNYNYKRGGPTPGQSTAMIVLRYGHGFTAFIEGWAGQGRPINVL